MTSKTSEEEGGRIGEEEGEIDTSISGADRRWQTKQPDEISRRLRGSREKLFHPPPPQFPVIYTSKSSAEKK